MDYLLYRLEFSTALHIGRDGGGASLDDGQMGIHADTLLAALCCEAARNGSITELVDYFADGILTISDAPPPSLPMLCPLPVRSYFCPNRFYLRETKSGRGRRASKSF